MFTGNKTIEDSLDLQSAQQVDSVCNDFEEAWEQGKRPQIETFLEDFTGTLRDALLSELVALEVQYRKEQGDLASPDDYLRRFPGRDDHIHAAFGRGVTASEFIDRLAEHDLLEPQDMASLRASVPTANSSVTADALAIQLVSAGKLTEFQADTLCTGRPDPLMLGDYRIVNRLGAGGMGVVYEANHARLGKRVALKVLRRESIADRQMLARFEREMKAVGQLNHPNIVGAHDAREDDGVHYLVMELVEGCDLAKLVKQHGRLNVPDACEVVRQAALGLQHACEHKLVHRDIKPSNLMLTRGGGSSATGSDGVVKILDLGLARLDQELSASLTTAGQVMGTLDYMAPEQADNSNEVDIRADIYSLGATLYKLLCGQAPFEDPSYNTTVKKLGALANATVPPIQQLRGDVPAELVTIVECMLAKDPHDRFATPMDVATALAPFASQHELVSLLSAPQVSEETICVQSDVDTVEQVASVSSDTTPSQATNASVEKTVPLSSGVNHGGGAIWSRILTVAIGFIAVVAALIVYRIQTNYGEVVVEIMDESVAAQLTAEGVDVIDRPIRRMFGR